MFTIEFMCPAGPGFCSCPTVTMTALRLAAACLALFSTVSSAPSSSSSGSGALTNMASGAVGLAAGIALSRTNCKDIGVGFSFSRECMVYCLIYQIDRSLCAVLYDEENCDRSGSFLSLVPGQQGELPRLTAGTR